MQSHPDWRTRYGAEFEHNVGDGVASFAWQRYLAKHPEEGAPYRDWDGNITQALIEQMTKKAFIEFAKRDPFFVLDMYVLHNPSHDIYPGRRDDQRGWQGDSGYFPRFLVALGLVIGIVSSRASMRLLFVSVPLVALLCFISSLPSWATLRDCDVHDGLLRASGNR